MLQLWPITSRPVHRAHRNTSVPFCTSPLLRDCHPLCFFKTACDLNLPSLVVFSRVLVARILLWMVFTWTCVQKRMQCSGWMLELLMWFAGYLLSCTYLYNTWLFFWKFTPLMSHVKWDSLSPLQIPCVITAFALVTQPVFVQVVILSQM